MLSVKKKYISKTDDFVIGTYIMRIHTCAMLRKLFFITNSIIIIISVWKKKKTKKN